MILTDYEIQEWHDHVLKQRNRYKRILEDIVCGVPTIYGMASDYRRLKMDEIVKLAKDALTEDKSV